MRDLENVFNALGRSGFRRSFRLKGRDLQYFADKGLLQVMAHAQDMIRQRLAPAVIPNDGKQTPFKGHPIFVAQHATACCCRGCLEKWHRIPAGRALTPDEMTYVLQVLEHWLILQPVMPPASPTGMPDLFSDLEA